MTKLLALIPLLALATGCPPPGSDKIINPGRVMREAFDDDRTGMHYIGRITADLEPLDGRETAVSKYSKIELAYLGIIDNQLCFTFEYEGPHQGGEDTLEDAIDKRERAFSKLTMVFEARARIDDISNDDPWPANPRSDITSAKVIESHIDNEPRKVGEGDEESLSYREYLTTRVQLCGRAPRITARAKYLTVMSFPNDGTQPSIFVWLIDRA